MENYTLYFKLLNHPEKFKKKEQIFIIKSVPAWLYLENSNSYLGITTIDTKDLLPVEINGLVMLKKEN